jgi:DNA-damage-inducible protein D
MEQQLIVHLHKSFEGAAYQQDGVEYWLARDLQILLGYNEWRNFLKVIDKAKIACESSRQNCINHFVDVNKMVKLRSGSERSIDDITLTRYACYLIAQNGDPRKPEIANAQKYFAIQARRQEISDATTADVERLDLRKQTAEEFKALSGAAREAGVNDKMFGIFHDAGYKGMYGGMGRDAIKRYKKIPEKENLMDRMDTTELAANQFRMTQTRDKLARERIKDQRIAIKTHENVGKEVREAISRIGGTPPEHLLPAEHIKLVEKRVKNTSPKLELEEKDAKGLIGHSEEE